MPNWAEVQKEIEGVRYDNPLDLVRRKYLQIMNTYTGRNVIAYYSGFLQNRPNSGINDSDKNALMNAVHGLDKTKGLDIILHTQGGELAATESIVHYLRSIFGNDIRAFVPQIAMSAGTMLALSCKEIVMGKQSNLGPIDPQFGGLSCGGVIEEFNEALDDIKKHPERIPIYQAMIAKYPPIFLGDCQKAIKWSESMAKDWLMSNMLSDRDDQEKAADTIVSTMGSHQKTYSHGKHLHIEDCEKLGIKITRLEGLDDRAIGGCKDLQDCVLTIHHSYMHAFSSTESVKIIENHKGGAMITRAQVAPIMK